MCPVQIFNFYLEKLNEKRNDLWQRPKRKVHLEDPVWFDDAPVGRDPLNNMVEDFVWKGKIVKGVHKPLHLSYSS